jgi:hypothetical protein
VREGICERKRVPEGEGEKRLIAEVGGEEDKEETS